jgi:hypothetical protein
MKLLDLLASFAEENEKAFAALFAIGLILTLAWVATHFEVFKAWMEGN